MKTFETKGGGQISGETNKELVQALNSASLFGGHQSLNAFMKQTSEACKMQTGADVRFDSFDNFIEDLIATGYLSEVSDAE